MKLCLFDDVPGGHHTAYLSGLASAAQQLGFETFVASPAPISSVDHLHSMRVLVTRHREVRAGRNTVRRVITWCEHQGIDIVADLYLDKAIWTWPRAVDRIPRTVHVLHHAHQYRSDPGKSPAERMRTTLARYRLRSWMEQGDTLIVHTRHAFETIRDFIPNSDLRLVGYPIRMMSTPLLPRDTTRGIELLFVGQARAEKGLPHLIDALSWLPPRITLTVVGSQNPGVRTKLETRCDTSRVKWIDRFVAMEELAAHYERATLIVLPYEGRFRDHGGASGVLLEALGHGRPIVTTSALASQLPDGYTGAVTVESTDPEALAEGIKSAIDDIEQLERAALADGPRFIASSHSFENYVGSLISGALA